MKDAKDRVTHFAHPEPILENEMGGLFRCDCGGFVLTMGPMSLHLNYDEANALHDLLCEGLDIADERDAAPQKVSNQDDAWH